jgi:hypothetical protein
VCGGASVAGLVRLYVPKTTRSERDESSRSSRSVVEGCNRAGDGETKGGLGSYLQARAVLYSSSDGRIVSMRATVESNGDVDGEKVNDSPV